jgi:hypothetical protein
MRRRFGSWLIAPIAPITLSALILGLLPAGHARAAVVEIEVHRSGGRFTVKAEAVLRADVATAFGTLTDYEHLPQFVPGVREVRVLRRERNGREEQLEVEQGGEFRAWWFTRRIRVRMDVVHANGDEVLARLAAASAVASAVTSAESPPAANDESRLRFFVGRYRVEPLPGAHGAPAIRLLYDAQFEPEFSVPRVIGTWAVRSAMADQFAAMTAEIERRFALR